MDQAKIVFNNVLRLIRGKPLMEVLVNCVRWSPYPQLYFANGAVFTARSTQNRGEHLLGNDYDFFSFDEAAFELHPEYPINDVITMRLADRHGMLDLISTPKGKNWFYTKAEEMARRTGACYVQTGSTFENSHVSREYLQRKMDTLSSAVVSQNIMGEFVDSGDEIVSEELIQAALARSTGMAPPVEGHRYCHGWDLARKVTYTVGVTIDLSVTPFQVVHIERFQGRDWDSVIAVIKKVHRVYGGEVLIDSTGLGDVVLSQLSDIGASGYSFAVGGGKAKADLLANLQLMHERQRIAYPYFEQADSGLLWSNVQELRDATWTDNRLCDFVMALALACWTAGRPDREADGKVLIPRAAKIQ
jgi:hypothetical protein